MNPFYILVFDTSMNACSVGIYEASQDTLISSTHEEMKRGQAESLLPLIQAQLEKSKLTYQDLSAIACTNGPGAFTGLRLSLATAKALSLSLNIPAIGVSTIETISNEYYVTTKTTEPYLICLETKRDDYYAQLFLENGHLVEEAKTMDANEINIMLSNHSIDNLTIVGDATNRLEKDFTESKEKSSIEFILKSHEISHPNIYFIGNTAHKYFLEQNNKKKRLINILPIYLKKPNITISSQNG